jgi:hypothetical protein
MVGGFALIAFANGQRSGIGETHICFQIGPKKASGSHVSNDVHISSSLTPRSVDVRDLELWIAICEPAIPTNGCRRAVIGGAGQVGEVEVVTRLTCRMLLRTCGLVLAVGYNPSRLCLSPRSSPPRLSSRLTLSQLQTTLHISYIHQTTSTVNQFT